MEFDFTALEEFLLSGGYIECGKDDYGDQLTALNYASFTTGFPIGFKYEDTNDNGCLRWQYVFADPDCEEVHMCSYIDRDEPCIQLANLSVGFPPENLGVCQPDFDTLFGDLGIS